MIQEEGGSTLRYRGARDSSSCQTQIVKQICARKRYGLGPFPTHQFRVREDRPRLINLEPAAT